METKLSKPRRFLCQNILFIGVNWKTKSLTKWVNGHVLDVSVFVLFSMSKCCIYEDACKSFQYSAQIALKFL